MGGCSASWESSSDREPENKDADTPLRALRVPVSPQPSSHWTGRGSRISICSNGDPFFCEGPRTMPPADVESSAMMERRSLNVGLGSSATPDPERTASQGNESLLKLYVYWL